MIVNLDQILHKKKKYGNSFPEIATKWSAFLDKKVSPQDVASMMTLMKKVRLKFISDNRLSEKVVPDGLLDTAQDLINYKWIAGCYDEYLRLEDTLKEDISGIQNPFRTNHF
ncbi:hypothetical protein HN803_04855 [candidate division WWE3 bacterium]|jgi:hypothetical protein|nr:hypothetical protein [candidate division WWE3 bacterium]